MENLLAEMMPTIIELLGMILTATAVYVGSTIKKYFNEKFNTETKRKVVETTCRYVNQIFGDLDGPAKLLKAKENILSQLNEKGVPITDLELEVLIESTVNGFKEAVNK